MIIRSKRLEIGYWRVWAEGHPNWWAQPPAWPCSEEVLRAHTFQPEWSERFIREAMASIGRAAGEKWDGKA